MGQYKIKIFILAFLFKYIFYKSLSKLKIDLKYSDSTSI